jgi:hypothetical protein
MTVEPRLGRPFARLAIPCALLLGCADSVAPTQDVTGTWVAAQVESITSIDLTQHGTAVGGTGTYWRFVNPPTGTLTITGTYVPPILRVTLAYDNGATATYTARALDGVHLEGTANFGGGIVDSLAFTRQ